MTTLLKLEMFNLTMLMSSFISFVRILSMVPSVYELTGFDGREFRVANG